MQAAVAVAMVRLAGVSEYGRYAYAAALVGPLALAGGLKLRSVVASDAHDELCQQEYRWVGWFAASVTIAVVAILATAPIVSRGAGVVMLMVALGRLLDGVAEAEYGRLQRFGHFTTNAHCVSLNALLTTGSVLAILWLGGTLELALGGSAVASAVTYAVAVRLSDRVEPTVPHRERPRFADVVAMTRRLLPLGAANAIGTARQSVPRIALEWTLGREAVGTFVAAYNILSVAGLPVSAVGVAATPRLARLYASGDTTAFLGLMRRLTAMGTGLAVLLVAGTVLLGEAALRTVYSEAVQLPWMVLVVMAMAMGTGFLYMFYGTAVNAMRLFSVQLRVATISLLVTAVVSAMLIPLGGEAGAAATLLLTAAVELALYAVLVRNRTLRHSDHWRGTSVQVSAGGGEAQ